MSMSYLATDAVSLSTCNFIYTYNQIVFCSVNRKSNLHTYPKKFDFNKCLLELGHWHNG